jgi:hypothetical protein
MKTKLDACSIETFEKMVSVLPTKEQVRLFDAKVQGNVNDFAA